MKLLITLFAIAAVAMAQDDANRVEKLLNSGNNQFTAKMFTEVIKSNPDKSVVLSAFSVLTPLALLGLASQGESHDELLKAIGFPNDNATKEVFSLVNSKLRSVKGVDLRMANRIYIPQNYELNEDFSHVSKDVFQSEVKNVDFTKNKETASAINAWVEDQTNHRIKDLVDPNTLDSNTRAVLVNALYFKGTWQDKFDAAATTERDFHVTKDNTKKLPTMYRKGHYSYAESAELNAKLLEIPYEGQESSFLIILPNEVDGIAALEEKLKDPSALTKAIENMHNYEVEVYLPKFKIETTTDLKDVLQKMDVKKLFTRGEARLTNLLKTNEDLYVSNALQKAFIEVNEEGAEAAAANVFDVVGTSFVIYEQRAFKADHPFVFVLKKEQTALFGGVFRS